MTAPSDTLTSRPRMGGDRELELLGATLDVLAEVGYDRLTMDAVAHRAHASKATLYRHWNGKLPLVIDALKCLKADDVVPDTGSLRGDLIATFCSPGAIGDRQSIDSLASVLTAMTHDAEFARAFRTEVVGPKLAHGRAIYERARRRGELREGVDLDLFAHALAGIVLHRHFVLGLPPDEESVAHVIDQIILPAVLPRGVPHGTSEPADPPPPADSRTDHKEPS